MINVPELLQLFQKNAKTVFAQEVERLEGNSWLACHAYVYDDPPEPSVEGAIHSCVKSLAEAMPEYADYTMPPGLQPDDGAAFHCFDDAIVPFRVVIVYSLGLPTGEYRMENGEFVLDEFDEKIQILKSGHMVTADAFIGEV